MNYELFISTLPIMAKGMLGILAVTLIIICSIVVLNKMFSKTKYKEDKTK